MAMLTFDKEESLLRGYIPLGRILDILKSGEKIEMIEFPGNGYCTDAILHLLSRQSPELFSELTWINLKGCYLLSDYGLKCLVKVLKPDQQKSMEICLDGCENVGDSTLAAINKVTQFGWSMKSSNVNFLSCVRSKLATQGSPSLMDDVESEESHKHGQVLVVPHSGLKQTFGKFLHLGVASEKQSYYHEPNWEVDGWHMAINDVSLNSCLFDQITNTGLSQVVIPFDAGSDPKEIKQHVMSTISRIIAKEPVRAEFPDMDIGVSAVTTTMSQEAWMDIHMVDRILMTEDNVLRSICTTDRHIGAYISRTPLTRSNHYFEVECTGGAKKVALLIGVLHDRLYSNRHPMDSEEDKGGVVDGFEITAGQKIGFGIEGEWQSEYVPFPSAKYYFIENNERKEGKDPTNIGVPQIGMYPLISVLGEEYGEVKLPPLVSVPEDLAQKWKKENRWIEKGYMHNCLVDTHGVISYFDSYNNPPNRAKFLSRLPISQQNSSFTVRIEELHTKVLGESSEAKEQGIWIGVMNESSKDPIAAYISTTKCVKFGSDSILDVRDQIPDIKVGDEITVKIDRISGQFGIVTDTCNLYIEFLINGKSVYKREDWQYTVKHAGSMMVPFVSLHLKGDRVTLKNYHTTYRKPAPLPDKVTMGRSHFINPMDNGQLEDSRAGKSAGKEYGLFIGKTPISRSQLEFNVEVQSLNEDSFFAIGLAHSDYPVNQFVGWRQNSVGYHADNGSIYCNGSIPEVSSGLKVDPDRAVITSGSKVGVRVEPIDDGTPLKFEVDGTLAAHQKMKVVFTKDGVIIHEYTEFWHVAESLHPAVSLRDAENRVKVLNFYPETSELWETVDSQKQQKAQADLSKNKKDKPKKENKEKFSGTEFLVVSVGSGSSDPTGKLQLVQSQIDLHEGWSELNSVMDSVSDMESNLNALDLQEQQNYTQLCAMQDNMKQLASNPKRIKYRAVDIDSKTGLDVLHSDIVETQNSYQSLQPHRFSWCLSAVKAKTLILELIGKEKIMKYSSEFSAVGSLLNGDQVMTLLKELHALGRLLLLNIGTELIIADPAFLFSLEEKMSHLLPTAMLQIGSAVPSIGQLSHVWDSRALGKGLLTDIPEEKLGFVKDVLQRVFALIRIECLRTKPGEEVCVYTTQQNVSNPPVPMTDYWSSTKDTKDFIVISQTYKFPTTLPEYILPLMIASTVKYGRVVILTGDGVVYQNGATQTVIVKHTGTHGKNVIVIESRCYMPDIEAMPDTKVSKETISYVRDYTWNIFCIYTDVIDDSLRRGGVVTSVTKKHPDCAVNVSVGCKHRWVHRADNVMVTVCTLCNNCCDKGMECRYNGIMGTYLRECGCGTEIVGCKDCGICISCAKELWAIRSRLRPYATSTTSVRETILQKTAKKTEEDGVDGADQDKKMLLSDPTHQPNIPLDSFLYNEMDFQNLSHEPKILCLREESDGTMVQAFPGKASYIQGLEQVVLSRQYEPHYNMLVGDNIRVRITDPLGASHMTQMELESKEEVEEVEPQWFAFHCREMKVIHETGIIVYDTNSSSLPVAQFIGCKPLTKDNNTFSVKILSSGKQCTIAIGLVPKNYPPNRQPGWNVQSIGYHADDGGVFLESGWPTRKTKTATDGDIMSLYIDFNTNKGFFRRNGEQCIELNLNPSRLGYYPCVGLHSQGEAVQLLEKDLWRAETSEDRALNPPAYPTYKYGNLWISPGKKVTMTKLSSMYCGWLMLHNPSKETVGFKVKYGKTDEDCVFGMLEYKADWVRYLERSNTIAKKNMIPMKEMPDEIVVEWTSLESGRTYKDDEIKQMFGTGSEKINQSSHQHVLPINVIESASVLEELPTLTNMPAPTEKSLLCMQIYKNMSLVDEYWLKYGTYYLTVETNSKEADFVLKYPKCPSFLYPRCFQKGMKITVCIEDESKTYAECIVVDIYGGGKMLALEYSPKNSSMNTTICVMTNSDALKYTEFNGDESNVLVYQARNTPANLTRTFVWTPPYLLFEGGKKCLEYLDQEWKANTLRAFSQCTQVFTRLTVQEHQINNASKVIIGWLKGESNYMYSYLPEHLSIQTMAYPQGHTMFRNVAVHRMCFSAEELAFLVGMEEGFRWRIPLHFVDIAGIKPSPALPLDTLYVNNPTAWTYVSLISDKLLLPSYSNMIEGDMGDYKREQIEQLLYNMCQIYAALCGIYSARVGGLEYTEVSEGSTNVPDYIKHGDKNVVRFTGNFHKETHMLIKRSGIMTCKAHAMNTGVNDQKYPGEIKFDYNFFEPYMDTVSSFFWCHSKMESLPKDFFKKFKHLQLLSIGDHAGKHMYKFKGLPEGIANAKELELVELCNNSMSELPADFFMSPTTRIVRLSNMPIKKLPKHWSKENKITELILQGLLISKVPDEIEYLQELTHLELCYNPITDLPESMSSLKKLQSLSLHGSPWITLEGKRSQMTYEQYISWMHTNSSIKFSLGEDVIEKLFHDFDYNHNACLDEEELAGLNLKLFFDIPHLGINDLNDEVTGGIPSVIFGLKSLNHLYLDYQAITMVPQAINNLQNLVTLSLNHNPLLESLPGSLGHLPNIKRIQLQSCPMLRTPPNEVVSRGFESVKAYLKRLAGGFTECRRTKLMVVGLGGAGKTSLLRALMSDKKKTAGTEKEIPTDGIDIVPWSVSADSGQEVTFSTWDFAGQAVYYNTHQFFLSKRAVYLLLWSMRQGYEHAGLDFWLSSISCHAPGTPILVVGTQCDLIPQAEIPEKELMERYPQIASFHRVSSITGAGVQDLQLKLLDVTLSQGYMGEKIPQVWLNFEKRILVERQTKKNYLKWDVARAFAMEAGIYDEKDVRLAVQLLHDLGTLQYFDNDFLQDYVVINPQWIVNVMACVVSAQDSPIQKHHGRFLHKDIAEIWKDYDEELRPWLLRLTEDFDLTFPLPKEPLNIVPCLLPTEEPEDLKWPSVRQQKGVRETKMEYRFTYLPSGLFNRAQVRLFQFSNGEQVWKKGSLLSKNKHLALIKQTDDKNLVVLVQGPRPENILFLIHEVFESIIEESFNGVSYDYHVPCPDCVIKEGTYDPFMFDAKLVIRGIDLKAPFIQCYKYFHWISMAQLQEKMPTDSRETSDFDFHLQQSMVALQELNQDLIIDTAIIYSSADIPKPGEDNRLAPRKIRDDVMQWGYQCWFAEDMDTISYVELTAAAKNCKVLIVLISDAFDRDTKCRDLFLYAKETMNKDIIIIVLGESMEWQNKDLGMKIGNQERLLMAKTLKRYMIDGGRRDEFKEWLDEKLTDARRDMGEPDVFISYNWANSRSASEKSGRQLPGALGWADPRQIKAVLHEAGINCWIDIENVGKEKKGIFADMTAGMRNSKMMLACISDEYADADNCMMELRFGILNMGLPLVVAVTGTGNTWKESEVAMLLRRAKAPEVYLQKENPEGFNSLVKFIKDKLMDITLKGKTKKEAPKDPLKRDQRKREKDNASNIAYQEEYELIQRKFMRHIIGAISNVDSMPLPRLIVVDFVKAVKSKEKSEGRSSRSMQQSMNLRRTLRPKTSTKSRDRLQIDSSVFEDDDTNDWQSESFCLKLLCEHEEGWHVCEGKYPLAFRTRDALETFFKKTSPYLYRINCILKQGPIKLKCFVSSKGDAFHSWIRSESEESHVDFVGALAHLRSELIQDEASNLLNCLARCRLPSGKIVWLCPQHQKWEHVSKLSMRSIGSYNTQKVLFSEDKLLVEHLEKSLAYRRLKAIKSTKVAPKLPPPVPMPTYEPKASMVRDEPKPKPLEPKKEETREEEVKKEEPKPELSKPSGDPRPNLAPPPDKDKSRSPNDRQPLPNTLPPPTPPPLSRSPASSAKKSRQGDRAELKKMQSMVVRKTGGESTSSQGRRKSSADSSKTRGSTTCVIQ